MNKEDTIVEICRLRDLGLKFADISRLVEWDTHSVYHEWAKVSAERMEEMRKRGRRALRARAAKRPSGYGTPADTPEWFWHRERFGEYRGYRR